MKYLKTLGLLAIAAAALTAFVSSASAQLTSPAGTAYTGTVKATSTNAHTTGSIKVACKHSSLEFSVSKGATTGTVTSWTFTQCDPDTVTVLKNGTVSIERTASNTGTIRSTGMEFTKLTHRTVLGFPVTSHCIYASDNTAIGHFTGGSPATFDVNGGIWQVTTDSSCGVEIHGLTGTYTVTSPVPLYLS